MRHRASANYEQGVPVRGDDVFRPDTWHSIALNVTDKGPEWNGQNVRFAPGENTAPLEGRWSWIDGRQAASCLIE